MESLDANWFELFIASICGNDEALGRLQLGLSSLQPILLKSIMEYKV